MGESLRAALGKIAEAAPDWLLGVVSPDWFDRYVHRFELQRLPKGELARETLRRQVGEDSWHRLASRDGGARSPKCPSLPQSGALASLVWTQHFEWVDGLIRGLDGPAVESAEPGHLAL